MASAEPSLSEQDIEKKIEETRRRFKTEYLKDACDRYDRRDLEQLESDDWLVDAYLTWQHYAVDRTIKMIDESFHWRKAFQLNDITESCVPKWTFETGAIYLHGYDKEGNKLFWFNISRHVKDAKTMQDKKQYVAFWLEQHVKQHRGKPLTVVFDMSDSGVRNIDLEFVKYIISCFRTYYPKLLSKMILYEMPWIMNAAWKIIKSWLDADSIEKLKFVSKNEVEIYISPDNLPPHMGGTDPFKYSYPPLPDDSSQFLVSENGPSDSAVENSRIHGKD
ncbi:motile sperm domain-containing protein 2-like [Paramormyrops kingsleyae]|uniref:motile sperm domain-containing protein 2-like n=1 Tax=Paramormyrops kingsleyae TaxID=1676925 RepID=UPI000CD5E0EF|nr:motile sperm domain-containing protein 2-like [Paramormyrops kingsleyae]